MRRVSIEEVVFAGLALLLAGVVPNLFPVAQAGIAKLSLLAQVVGLPAVALLLVVAFAAGLRGHRRLVRRVRVGAAAGLVATLGLEVVRATSFRLGGMPGDLPRLLGVLLTDRFMLGPSAVSDALGYVLHFATGAAFGIIFAVLVGRKPAWWAVVYGQLIGIGFLASPAVTAMGVGRMGSAMPTMQVTVVLAHLAFGAMLGWLLRRWLRDDGWLLAAPLGGPR